MTKEEVQAKSAEKIKKVQALCEELQLIISAEQVMTDKGFIKMVTYYTDAEKYNISEEPITEKKDEK